MIKISIILSIILVLSSCSHSGSSQNSIFDGVSIENDARDTSPLIEKKNNSYTSGKKVTRTPVVSLFFGPGLYQVLGYVPVLKSFDQHKIRVSMVSGVGMGALVAALYAKKVTPDLIEWKLTNLFQRLKKEKIYSKEWVSIVDDFVQAEFGTKKIQHMNRYLVLPAREQGSVFYQKRGGMRKVLNMNLVMSAKNPIGGNFIPFQKLKNKGADIIFAFDIMRENVNFVKYDDYIYGVYSKAAGMMLRSDKFIKMNVKLEKLDSVSGRQNLIADSDVWIKDNMSEVKQEINSWMTMQKNAEE